MTIFIENSDTHEFLSKEGSWTKHFEKAVIYRSSAQAKAFAETAPIGRFHVIGGFHNSTQLVNLDEGHGVKG